MIATGEDEAVENFLLQCGYAVPVPEAVIPRLPDGTLLRGGLFMIQDRPGKWRLLYDGRPPNDPVRSLDWLSLPQGKQLDQLIVPLGSDATGSGVDLDSYFNRLAQSESGLVRAAFGRSLPAEQLRALGLPTNIPHRLCVAVMAMGGKNSPPIAQ